METYGDFRQRFGLTKFELGIVSMQCEGGQWKAYTDESVSVMPLNMHFISVPVNHRSIFETLGWYEVVIDLREVRLLSVIRREVDGCIGVAVHRNRITTPLSYTDFYGPIKQELWAHRRRADMKRFHSTLWFENEADAVLTGLNHPLPHIPS